MIAKKNIESKFREWNEKWHAPFGRTKLQRYIPKKFRYNQFLGKYLGMFAYQPNNNLRVFEYPCAYYASKLSKGMTVLDIGGGFSGFPFVLSKLGMNVTNVDPFFQYGSDNKNYTQNPYGVVKNMNRIFTTNVRLKKCTLENAELASENFDRIFCISVIEHMPVENMRLIMDEVYRILKPEGLFILTVDLFLNLIPFSKRKSNQYGQNISIKNLIEMSHFKLVQGNKEELFGFSDFDSDKILSNLEKYFICHNYPALSQAFVLKK